jgi:anti-sigma factor RsiW
VTCREFADFIMGYLTGELPSETLEPFERHISRCPNCEEYLRQYKNTIEAGKRAFHCLDDEVPDEVPEDLVKAILASRSN